MARLDEKKRDAIALHSRQAAEFVTRYLELAADPYGSCFSYSRYRLGRLLDLHLPENGDGRRLLDVGCGTGHHLAVLQTRGFDVAGVDGSKAMLTQARAGNPDMALVRADVEALPFPAGSFDFLLCIEVLRYLPQSAGCLREIRRVLKPGGVCLATATPMLNLNGYWLVNRAARLLRLPGLVRLKQYFHTVGGLRCAFSTSGFGTVEVHGVYLGPVNWVGRVAPGLLPAFLRRWERVDAMLADRVILREFSNMVLVCATRDANSG
jgi:ubiquinone/menaquinone biosynthesis C-methylase UbiE